jgi:hypothetical protein
MGTTCLSARGGLAGTVEFFATGLSLSTAPVAAKQGNKCGVSSTRMSGLGRDAKVTSNRCPSTRPWDLFLGTPPCKPVDRPQPR